MRDRTADKGKWIPEQEYDEITKKIPILGIDVLPLKPGTDNMVGLMLRDTYWRLRRWCLVGIGVQHGEPIVTAIQRAFHWSLGDGVSLDLSTLQLRDVVEYFPEPDTGEFFDPRKHAVALTYTCIMTGRPEPQGKAIDFKWFARDALPESNLIGFGQGQLLPRLLNSLYQDTQSQTTTEESSSLHDRQAGAHSK
ncbi:DUF4916 domain-containing protein [Amycolatopsis sp. NPDC049868]|uniref:DUF4916 domain-containing protein n=1 Tax=Amycolatopsis sp. NPDC049868 TaxID=3363934 RepID=UPI0037B243F5